MAGKFEVYQDKAGKFPFRAKARRGPILLAAVLALATLGAIPVDGAHAENVVGSPPPTAVADSYSTAPGQGLTVSGFAGVLVNDKAVNQHPMTTALVSGAVNGTVTLGADGGFTYSPNAGFTGTDTFTYTATETMSGLTSSDATVTITVPAPETPNTTPLSKFHPLAPLRLIDTRIGLGTRAIGALPAQSLTEFNMHGDGVPFDLLPVSAVVLNVTATEPRAAGFIQVIPSDLSLPPGLLGSTSSLNVDHPGQTISNLVIVGVDGSGNFDVFSEPSTQLVCGHFRLLHDLSIGRRRSVGDR
jgi:hypothetical protein